MSRTSRLLLTTMLGGTLAAAAQQGGPPPAPAPLDLGRNLVPLVHKPLPEQYIWTAGDATFLRPDRSKYSQLNADARVQPHRFRRTFQLDRVPPAATLYLAGPRSATVWLNGHRLASFASDPDGPMNFRMFHVDVTHALRPGANTLALEVVRGRGVVSSEPIRQLAQLGYGEVLAVKILAAPFGHDGADLVHSDTQWTSEAADASTPQDQGAPWTLPDVKLRWKQVDSLGGVESSRSFFQWGVDAGMYAWPGYRGMSPWLGTYDVTPSAITHVFQGTSHLTNVASLTTEHPDFTVLRDPNADTDLQAPALLVDFGREVAGRLLIDSDSSNDATISIAYGESEIEALATGLTSSQRGGNYLGVNLLDVPATGTVRGPKSAFRYVRIRFLRGTQMKFRIRAEAIAYPVAFTGSFESSDPLLNQIWETGAYTVHLCMQDDLWDAPKRDRGRWTGDMDVEGRVLLTAFGETSELERTLAALGEHADGKHHINNIPGYSALWITTLADLYAHAGNLDYVRSQKAALLNVLAAIEHSTDPSSAGHTAASWGFIDWAPGLYGSGADVQAGTQLQYIRGFHAAATLFRALGDTANASRADASAESLRQHLADTLRVNPELFGHSPQLAALTLTSGFTQQLSTQIYDLPHIQQVTATDPAITPYMNMSVLDALSLSGHQREALNWMRTYWGGMLKLGATSFWENYDGRWPRDSNFALSLQADGVSGYFASFAHGWSAGPTAWLSENVLGIQGAADGFRTVTIAPRLLGLTFARGAVPTPHGALRVSAAMQAAVEHLEVQIPEGVEHARISLPPLRGAITLDGAPLNASADPQGDTFFTVKGAGRHTIDFTPSEP